MTHITKKIKQTDVLDSKTIKKLKLSKTSADSFNQLLQQENIQIESTHPDDTCNEVVKEKKDEYNVYQEQFVNAPLNDAKLLGIPGGGKTRTIIEKIIYLFKNGDLNKNDQFLVLTFSRKAKDDFLIKSMAKDENIFTKTNVRTLHSISGTIVNSYLKRQSKSIETVILAALKIIKSLQQSDEETGLVSEMTPTPAKETGHVSEVTPTPSKETGPPAEETGPPAEETGPVVEETETPNSEEFGKVKIRKRKYKKISINELDNVRVIFIDEAQDISELYYEFLIELKKLLGCCLIMVGDPNQSIYQFKNGSDKFLLEHKGDDYFLIDNYRSTKAIVDFINYFRPWKQVIPPMKTINDKGTKPFIYINNIFAIKYDILKELRSYVSNGGNLKNVAIIGPVKYAKLDIATNSYKSIGLQLVANWLETQNIKSIKHYGLAGDEIESGDAVKEYTDDHVNMLTIHGSKGLEFDKVLILNFHHQTFSKNPTESDYNVFEYLWYVALSRAQRELKIYVDCHKKIFKKILDCPKNLYLCNKSITDSVFPMDKERTVADLGITDMINNNKIFNEKAFDFVETNFDIKCETINMYSVNKTHTYIDNIFLGIFFEYIYIYYFYTFNNLQFKTVIQGYIDYFNNIISISSEHYHTVKQLGMHRLFKSYTLSDIEEYKNLNDNTKDFYEYLYLKVDGKRDKLFSFFFENDIIGFNYDELLDICNNILKEKKTSKNLFYISKFIYQYETESKNLLNHINDEMFEDLKYWIKKIKNYCKKTKLDETNELNKVTVHQEMEHFYLNINGEADLIVNNNIIELKFTKSITTKHVIQVLLYYMCINKRWPKTIKFDIINLQMGIRAKYKIKPLISNFKFLMYLAKITGLKINKPIIMYDLETTGLNTLTAEIIERHLQDYVTNSEVSSGLIRPRHSIPKVVEELTHISNDMVKDAEDIYTFKEEIIEIYKYCVNPIFMAHNGIGYDHKIMTHQKLLDKENSHYFLDSKLIIRLFTEYDTLKKKLGEIYTMVTGKVETDAHRAYADVKMMVEIFDKLEIDSDKIISLV